jgi:hypothetical protein
LELRSLGHVGAFILGLRYAIERRRQRRANAVALGFLSDEPDPIFQEAR